MNTRVVYKTFEQLSIADYMVYSKLPRHPFWSVVDEKIDFSFADELCSFLYTGRGQYPYAPSLKLKIHLLQSYYQISDRQTEEKIMGDLFIKRFLGLPMDFFGFDHSTIGLDRSRMGSGLFQACHRYILAQMYQLGLWGDNEAWIIDSFPVHVHARRMSGYRMIRQTALGAIGLLQRYRPAMYAKLKNDLKLEALECVPSSDLSKADYLLGYSRMATQAHGLLVWLTQANALHMPWPSGKARQRLTNRLALLEQLLNENTEPTPPEASAPEDLERKTQTHGRASTSTLPKSRIYSLRDPEARIGQKGKRQFIEGYKAQNLMSARGVVLDIQMIPADEHDREAMVGMVQNMLQFWSGTHPTAVLGDTLYGHHGQRTALAACGVQVVAPVAPSVNPSGLWTGEKFSYEANDDVYRCPQGKQSFTKSYIKASEGWQYKFPAADCTVCPVRSSCTTNPKGRTVFRHRCHEQYEQARAYNLSTEGVADLRLRKRIERKNNELKNQCGLNRLWTCSKETARIKANLAGITANLKLVTRRFSSPGSGFVRHAV